MIDAASREPGEWAHDGLGKGESWNPIRARVERVSEGCDMTGEDSGLKGADKMQTQIRKALADFALANVKGDNLMIISGVTTECVAAIFELCSTFGYCPTEAQFNEFLSKIGTIIAHDDHLAGVHKKGGRA